MDKGNFVLGGITTEEVLRAVALATDMHARGEFGVPTPDYVDENVSIKVVKLIQSYTGIVNRVVWGK